jgi:murein DD-endopeptidase MepM/ murein hydrolase activator NlpD
MAARGPIDILVVGHDGRRLFSLRLDVRALCAGLVVMLVASVAGGVATVNRPSLQSPSPLSAPSLAAASLAVPLPSSAGEQPCGLVALVEQRLPAIESEIAGWREAQAGIRKALRVRQAVAETVEPAESNGSLLTNQLDRLLTIIHAEARNLRALEPFVAQAARALAGLPSRWPVRAAVSSEFGHRLSPWSRAPEFHEGIDIVAKTGTRVVAPSAGRVAFVGSTAEYGNTLLLDHGNEIRTRFGHLERVSVVTGQQVERGQPIAITGNTGRTTGPHLHYEVIVRGRPVNPRPYLAE